jgi:hypothetical protein
MNIALKYQDRVDVSNFMPQVNWRNPHNDRRKNSFAAVRAAGTPVAR